MNWHYIFDLMRGEMASGIVSSSTARLLLAAVLCGLIGLHRSVVACVVTGSMVNEISKPINLILEPEHRMMQNVVTASTPGHVRLQFDAEGRHREQLELLGLLKQSPVFGSVVSLGPVERE